MSSSYFPIEDEWVEEEFLYLEPVAQRTVIPAELVALVAAVLVAVALAWGALSLIRQPTTAVSIQPRTNSEKEADNTPARPAAPPLIVDPAQIIAPYDSYVVTQGIHGLSYGHMAVDIAAGKGVPIKSPISGTISESYIDAVGNPTLVIENERYVVTLLHGIYSVSVGDQVQIGRQIGVESNIGNTRDMQGNSCRNRDCGYHTHLNVFDKEANSNVNPLALF